MSCTGQKLSALTFAPDLAPTDLFYMAEDLGGGIFFERKVELSQLDSRWVNTSGDAMTGVLSMGGFQITNLGAPVNPNDATTKTYVDSLVGAGSPPFTDTTPLVKGSADPTKLLRFEVDGLSVGTRVLTPQDADYTIAGLETLNIFTVNQTFSAQALLSNGIAAAPSLAFTSETNTGLYRAAAGEIGFSVAGGQKAEITATELNLGTQNLAWSGGFGSAVDLILARDGGNNLAQRNGTNQQQFHLYNTYTGGGLNYERLNLEWNGNNAFLSTEQLGTGVHRSLALGSEGNATVSLRTNGTNWFTVLGTGSMTGALGTKTASTPIFDLSETWNAAVTFTAFKQNITDTLSNAASLLIDMQVNAATVWSLGKSGVMNLADNVRQTFNPGATVSGFNFGSVALDPGTLVDGDAWYQSTANELRFRINGVTVSFPSATTPLAVTRGGTGTATQFTQGSVIFAGPSGVYAEDNANFFWDDTGNQLFLGGATAAAADTLLGANGSAIFNEQGASVDFRVESDTKTHMLFVQGSTNRIGLNTSAPTQMFELWGTVNTANRYLLFDDTGWIRFQFQSSHATIGTIWNLTSGKDWYFGEAVDLGTYFFRGRNFDISPAVSTTGAPANFKFTGAAHTGLTASTEVIDAHFSLSRSVQHATGALATQRAFVITNPTYSFVGASTITNAATFAILGAPVAGTNATLTNSYSLWVQAGTSRFDGNISMGAARTLSFVSGTDQRAGNAVLVAGTVTVNNTTVTANTIVMLTRKTAGGTVGTLITYTVAAGTSFTINSDSALDTSTFSYMLIEVP